MPEPILPISPETLWLIHRAALGGKSAITGAELPATLADCPKAVQAAHYAMALGASTRSAGGLCSPPASGVLSEEEIEEIGKRVNLVVPFILEGPREVGAISVLG